MKRLFKLFFILVFCLVSCKENQFKSFDDEVTAESLWFDFIQHLNKKEFTEAIALLPEIPDSIKLRRENLIRHSSAYAGVCGLDLLELINDSGNLGTATPIGFLMSTFTDPTLEKITACNTAIALIENNVSDQADQRNSDENIAMMAYLMINIGLFLNSRFDLDNNGAVDPAADSCNVTQISDIETAQVGASLTKMFLAAQFISGIDLLTEIQDEIQSGCDLLTGALAPLNFCSQINPASYSADQIRGVRSIIQEGVDFGMGSCTSSPNNLVNCVCP